MNLVISLATVICICLGVNAAPRMDNMTVSTNESNDAIQISPSRVRRGTTINNYTYLTNSQLGKSKSSWDEAKIACESLGDGSSLVVVDGDEARDAVARIATTDVWIGLKKSNSGEWMTVTGEVNKYNGWDISQPNGGAENRAMQKKSSKRWHDYPTSAKFDFICQTSDCFPAVISTATDDKERNNL